MREERPDVTAEEGNEMIARYKSRNEEVRRKARKRGETGKKQEKR